MNSLLVTYGQFLGITNGLLFNKVFAKLELNIDDLKSSPWATSEPLPATLN